MKLYCKYFFCFLCMAVTLTGCSPASKFSEKEIVENKAHLEIGRYFEVNNTNDSLILHDYKEALAGDGLYYATWHIGDAKPYENSEGKTVDIYNAQLYLLLCEFTSNEKALDNRDAWLETGRANYDISGEKEITCNGQDYLIITYTFKNENNPYARGVSAFAVHDKNALCAELTCQEDFDEDLDEILTTFLNNCTYK